MPTMKRTAFYGDDVTFQGKLDGTVQKFTLDSSMHHMAGDGILDGNGNPVDGRRIVYPTWDPMLGLTAGKQQVAPHRYAEVTRDEMGDIPTEQPPPALPIAYGDEEEDEPDEGDYLGPTAYAARENRRAAQRMMVRQSLKDFSDGEKQALIDEGTGGFRDPDLLDVNGTHYQGMLQDGAGHEAEWNWL
jgi:hypothetical protein